MKSTILGRKHTREVYAAFEESGMAKNHVEHS